MPSKEEKEDEEFKKAMQKAKDLIKQRPVRESDKKAKAKDWQEERYKKGH